MKKPRPLVRVRTYSKKQRIKNRFEVYVCSGPNEDAYGYEEVTLARFPTLAKAETYASHTLLPNSTRLLQLQELATAARAVYIADNDSYTSASTAWDARQEARKRYEKAFFSWWEDLKP